jgi:hypothetical protein
MRHHHSRRVDHRIAGELRLLAIAEEQSLTVSFSRRGRLTTRIPEEGETLAAGQEVARIEEPGLSEDASDIERQISQVKARDLTRLEEIEKLRAQFAAVASDERRIGRLVKEGGAEGVKLEGGERYVPVIQAIVNASIPVVGHLGLTPQSLHQLGGYRVQGKDRESAETLIRDARSLERAGCFSIVLEGIPWQLAERITDAVSIPTIGIGAGPHCSGQILVIYDMLGIYEGSVPKFVKKYDELGERMRAAISTYAREVREGRFPGMEHSYSADDVKKDRAPGT